MIEPGQDSANQPATTNPDEQIEDLQLNEAADHVQGGGGGMWSGKSGPGQHGGQSS